MLAKVTVLLCLCLTLAVAKPAKDSKNELMALQQEAREVLSSLSTSCTTDSDTLLLAAQTTALYQSTNCSVTAFTSAVAKIYLYSAEYVSEALKVVTKIGLHFSGCPLKIVPKNIISCVFKGILELPAEIQTLINVSFQYFGKILALVPPLLSDIESCFTSSVKNYELMLEDLVHSAKVCDAKLKP